MTTVDLKLRTPEGLRETARQLHAHGMQRAAEFLNDHARLVELRLLVRDARDLLELAAMTRPSPFTRGEMARIRTWLDQYNGTADNESSG